MCFTPANPDPTHQPIKSRCFSLSLSWQALSLFSFLSLPPSSSLHLSSQHLFLLCLFPYVPFFFFFSLRFTSHFFLLSFFFLINFLSLFKYAFEGFPLQGLWSEIALYCGFEFFFSSNIVVYDVLCGLGIAKLK